MAKFGDIIESEIPVMIGFYDEHSIHSEDLFVALKDTAAELGDKVKVIKIRNNTNEVLINALRIKHFPTYILYKKKDMHWRQAGVKTGEELVAVLKNYI
jgi:thioredoxin 1